MLTTSMLAAAALAAPVPFGPAPLAPGVDPVEIALAQVGRASPGASYAVDRAVGWGAGVRVRLIQDVGGVPVEGRFKVVSVAPDGAILRVAGGDPIAPIDVVPVVTDADAMEIASLWAQAVTGGTPAWTPYAGLVVHLDPSGAPHLAWAVHLATVAPSGAGSALIPPFGAYTVYVDAHDAEVIGHARASFDARANIYPSNPVASAVTEVDLQGLVSADGLVGDHAYAWSCDDFSALNVCREKSSHALPDADGDYLFQPQAVSLVDPFAEVQMYHHLDLVYRWFEDRVGFHLAAPIQGLVNFPLNNAFYGDADGDGVGDVAFGQAYGIDFAYDSDVVYHEFGHAVIGNVTSLGLFGADEYGLDFTPLSLNEGSADTFSTFISGDPHLGEYVGPAFGLPEVRDLGPDRRCPDDLYGEGHEDGIIWGSVGWNMAEDPLIGAEVATQVFFGGISSWTTDTITWSEAGQSLVDSAEDLYAVGAIDAASRDAAVAYVTDAGLIGCERVIPLDDGTASTQFFIAAGAAAAVGGYVPLSAQFSLEVPADATAAVVSVDYVLSTLPAATPWTVFVRKGQHVEHVVQSVFGLSFPVPDQYDFTIDGTGVGEARVDAASTVPLEPGATYYFSVATRADGLTLLDLGFGEITISGHVERAGTPGTTPPTTPPPGDDDDDDATGTPDDPGGAVDGDDSEREGGCGCDAPNAPATGLGWALGLAVVIARRRRHRRAQSPEASPDGSVS